MPVLSNMFTQTQGTWADRLFGTGAFLILFSTALSGIGAGSRVFTDHLTVLGFLDRSRLCPRIAWIRGYATLVPLLGYAFYLWVESAVLLVSVGALAAALLSPIQSGATIWLQAHHMDARLRPGPAAASVKVVFVLQVVMAWLVIRYVVF